MSIILGAVMVLISAIAIVYLKKNKEKNIYEKFKIPILIILATGILVIIGSIKNSGVEILDTIARPQADEESEEIEAYAKYDKKDYPVRIEISKKEYTKEQLSEIFEKTYEIIIKDIPTEGERLEHVTKDLNLMTKVKDTGVKVEWTSGDPKVIQNDGEIVAENIPSKGTEVTLNAMMTFEESIAYYDITAIIYPREYTQDEKNQMLIDEAVKKSEEKDEEKVELPDTISDKDVTFFIKKEDSFRYIGILGIVGAVAIFVAKNRQEKDKEEKRKKQLELEYSEMVSKLTLLAGAGMTISSAWEKIVKDYLAGKDQKDFKRKEVYEEMATTYYKMQSGMSETVAYEDFARRCNTPLYLQFGTLLSQNVRKGTANLLRLLDNAANEAFIHRKQLAKQQGEEATTKLLVPMIMMLGIVMIIVIFPAFVSFNM